MGYYNNRATNVPMIHKFIITIILFLFNDIIRVVETQFLNFDDLRAQCRSDCQELFLV